MRKSMSVSRFALGSLKARWRRQISLVIGIMLAVCFVSGLFLLSQSIYYSYQERYHRLWGRQDLILRDAEEEVGDPQRLKEIGVARLVGEARVFGESVEGGVAFGGYDAQGEALRYLSLVSGRMPEKPGEVAIEAGALEKLRLDIGIGDSFDIALKTPLKHKAFLEKTDTRHYTLVGMLHDQRVIPPNMFEHTSYYGQLPQAVTPWGEQAAPGGREVVHYLIQSPPLMSEERANQILSDAGIFHWALGYGFKLLEFDQGNLSAFLLILALTLGCALVLTACMAIINALNTSLNERSRQIGMLRAVGATSRQIRRVYGREALITAIVTAPLSILIACGAVALLIRLVGEPLRLHAAWWFLPVTLLLSVAVVLMAAAIPLRRASLVSPMQAIRDTSMLRARRRLKVRPRERYAPASLLARRHVRLYRSRQAGIALIVAISMVTLCLAYAGLVFGSRQQGGQVYDYMLSRDSFSDYRQIDYSPLERHMSESDIAEAARLPHIGRLQAAKRLHVNLNVPKLSDYMLGGQYNWQTRMYIDPREGEDTAFWTRAERDWYLKLLKKEQIDGELFNVDMVALDDSSIQALKACVVAGEIDLAALHAGREVVVTAPEKLYVVHNERDPEDMTQVVSGLSEGDSVLDTLQNDAYAVGDRLSLVWLRGTDPEKAGIIPSDEDFSSGYERLDREVTIGALIDLKLLKLPRFVGYDDLNQAGSMLTSLPGLRALGLDEVGYHALSIKLDGEPGEDGRALQHDVLQAIAQRGDGIVLRDSYRTAQEQRRWMAVLWAAVASLIMIFFVLTLSMVNNALTNRLKADRSAIGTLRAVGADMAVIFRSYRYQIYYMLLAGGLAGLILGPLTTVYLLFWRNGPPPDPKGFSIPVMLGMLAAYLLVMVLLCSLNLRLRLRQMARSSIVDNIREL